MHNIPSKDRPVILAAESLFSAETAAKLGEISLTGWYERVRKGDAPQPAIRRHRFTRWRAADVLAYWKRIADEGSAEVGEPSTIATAKRIRAVRTANQAARLAAAKGEG